MINKLPIVGKRYKDLGCSNLTSYELKAIHEGKKDILFVFLQSNNTYASHSLIKGKGFKTFFDFYEELPENKAEIKPKTQNKILMKIIKKINPPMKESEEAFFIAGFEECLKLNNKTQSHISELSPEVKEAMGELRKEVDQNEIDKGFPFSLDWEQWRGWYRELQYLTQNLLNSLDKQFGQKQVETEKKLEEVIS